MVELVKKPITDCGEVQVQILIEPIFFAINFLHDLKNNYNANSVDN